MRIWAISRAAGIRANSAKMTKERTKNLNKFPSTKTLQYKSIQGDALETTPQRELFLQQKDILMTIRAMGY